MMKRPPENPKQQENLMINLAMKHAEEKLRDGTASSQIVTHFLKLATEQNKLELEKMRIDADLARKKIELIESQKQSESLYQEAMNAFKLYNGVSGDDEDDDLIEQPDEF